MSVNARAGAACCQWRALRCLRAPGHEGEDEGVDEGVDAAGEQKEARRRGAPLAGTADSSPVETPSGSPATSCGRV